MKVIALFCIVCIAHTGTAQEVENEINQLAKSIDVLHVELSISPNPSYGTLRIHAPDAQSCVVNSIAGTYIGTWQMDGEDLVLDGLPMGTYIAQVTFQAGKRTKKFVVL